jgi:hypothetical protein
MNLSSIEFVKDKDCKHSVRYAAIDPKAPIQSIYVSREFADGSVPLIVTLEKKGGAK